MYRLFMCVVMLNCSLVLAGGRRLPDGIKSGDQLMAESRKPTVATKWQTPIKDTKSKFVLVRLQDGHDYLVLITGDQAKHFTHHKDCKKCKEEK